MPTPPSSFDTINRSDLRILADRLRTPDTEAVEQCVAFIEATTLQAGHGRVRARMARRLKHCQLTTGQRERLLRVILLRLISGRFAEQFKDHLRLALHLDAEKVYAVARSAQHAEAEYVRRYAAWILAHEN